jgi:hypothetical protein
MKGMNALLQKPHYSWGGYANSIASYASFGEMQFRSRTRD